MSKHKLTNLHKSQIEILVVAFQQLSMACSLSEVQSIVEHQAKMLLGSDDVTIVLKDNNPPHSMPNKSPAPLSKESKFQLKQSMSHWVMLNKRSALIADIDKDKRIPSMDKKNTYFRSLVLVPIRNFGAIGSYWKNIKKPTKDDENILSLLADSTASAIEKIIRIEQLEQHVKERTKELEVINQALEGFNYSVSHDLQGPIGYIKKYAKKLKTICARYNDLEAQETSTRLLLLSEKISTLINDLLKLAHAQYYEIELEVIDLSQICHDFIDLHKDELSDRKIKWNIESNMKILADKGLLTILVDNILSNSLKYTKRDLLAHISVTIKEQSNEMIIIEVRDDGLGFKCSDPSLIFKPFMRLHANDFSYGSGIGLTIAAQIVKRHNGTITATSKENQGTSLFICLHQ